MSQAYRGVFRPTNPSKYEGDPTKVVFRSHWERQVFRWLDSNPDVLSWSSEEVVIPYRCPTDGKVHRYFPDIKCTLIDGRGTYLIEIKPKKETVPPRPPKGKNAKSARYVREVFTWAKNTAKWEAAQNYAVDRGWKFQTWTEDTIKGMGIRLLTG